MRTFVPMVLAVSLVAAGVPVSLSAQETGALRGTALQTNLQPFSNARIQLRSIRTATVVYSTTSGQSGEFAFSTLNPDTYIVEIVDRTGRVVGMTPPTSVVGDAVANVSVTASAAGTVEVAGKSAGFSLFGLGPTTSFAVLGAAGATAVTAVVATRPNASPSR
jgi:hypothetical protein